jgi:mannose-1-phosphate guanylyltransferase
VIEEGAVVDDAIIWPGGRLAKDSLVRGAILGRHCHIGRSAVVGRGVVMGDKSAVTDYSRLVAEKD